MNTSRRGFLLGSAAVVAAAAIPLPVKAITTPVITTPIPEAWLLCDGQSVSRRMYTELFAVLGTTYGGGDGATTFNVPDFRGRTVTPTYWAEPVTPHLPAEPIICAFSRGDAPYSPVGSIHLVDPTRR